MIISKINAKSNRKINFKNPIYADDEQESENRKINSYHEWNSSNGFCLKKKRKKGEQKKIY